MSVQSVMNSPVTRIQVFAVWALCALMLLGALGLVALGRLQDRLPIAPAILGRHGIETTWPSTLGENRLWTLSAGGTDYRPWLEDHIAAVTEAERLMPPRK